MNDFSIFSWKVTKIYSDIDQKKNLLFFETHEVPVTIWAIFAALL